MDKLSQDAAAARAAGMSYGKWKALQPRKPPAVRYPLGGYEKQCPICGKTFTSRRKDCKYCGPECKDKARQRQLTKSKEHQ